MIEEREFMVPIYGANVVLVVSDNIVVAYEKHKAMFTKPVTEDLQAACAYDGKGNFGLFFEVPVKRGHIAHEVFHLTHRILEWTNSNFDAQHHEQGALLNEWLTEEIASRLEKMFPQNENA